MSTTAKRSVRKRKVLKDLNQNSDSDFESDNANIKYVSPEKQSKVTKSREIKSVTNSEASQQKLTDLVWKCEGVDNKLRDVQIFKSSNLLNILHNYSSGILKKSKLLQAAALPVIDNVAKFGVARRATSFYRPVTAIAWHPHYPSLAAAGSKGGDLILWDSNNNNNNNDGTNKNYFKSMIQGRGPGGSIQSLKFDDVNQDRVYTASIDGTVTRHDFSGQNTKVYLDTEDWEKWYTGLDVSFSGRMIVAGNNRGYVTLLSLEGEKIWDLKLHKSKCNFVQFSQKQPWMMVTTSIGGCSDGVKIWDIRNISDKKSALMELPHDTAVNSAYFSPVSGDKLLTTDQHSQLRVYQGPNFYLLKTIPHPHRQNQLLTPIKACWHPLADVVFAGRVPDPTFPGYREGEICSIDFFCPETGTTLYQLHQPGLQQIISLSQFNPSGDTLLSGMGSSVLMWQPRPERQEECESQIYESNIEGIKVQQWPDFKAKKKAQSKKVKALS